MTDVLELLAFGCLSPHHATQFRAFVKQIRNRYTLSAIIDGKQKWPNAPENRDALYFLAQSFKAQLIKELPLNKDNLSGAVQNFSFQAKALIKDLANISLEIAQMAVSSDNDSTLPDWFVVEVIRVQARLGGSDGSRYCLRLRQSPNHARDIDHIHSARQRYGEAESQTEGLFQQLASCIKILKCNIILFLQGFFSIGAHFLAQAMFRSMGRSFSLKCSMPKCSEQCAIARAH